MKREHFVKVVEETLDSLPAEFRSRIRNVAVLVEDVPPNQPSPQPVQPRHDRGSYFDFATDPTVAVRQIMAEQLRAMGLEVNTLHHEVGCGQHEIDVGAQEALKAADDVVTFRYTLRAIAQQHGLTATFMPKPFQGQPGSGMHVHQSLARVGDGGNAFAGDDDYGLSDVAKHFIAGQLHHAAGMCLVLAPLIRSEEHT